MTTTETRRRIDLYDDEGYFDGFLLTVDEPKETESGFIYDKTIDAIARLLKERRTIHIHTIPDEVAR